MPPSTRVSAGCAAAVASAAAAIMLPKIVQPGSSSKSQWDMLFGSFQNITASTMIRSLHVVGSLQQWDFEPGLTGRFTDEHFLFGLIENVEPGAAQHRAGTREIRNPPVCGVACVSLFDETHAGKSFCGEDALLFEWIILTKRLNLFRPAQH